MGKHRRTVRRATYTGLTGLQRESEMLGMNNPALAAALANYPDSYSQIYGASSVPSAATTASSADSWPFHSIGGPNDVLVPKGEAAQQISELLGRVTHKAGEYSFGGEAKTLPAMAGVAFKDDDDFIALPLQKENCDKLLKRCTKDGEEVYTLPGEQVEMRNPEWTAGIDELSDLSAARMGYKGVVMSNVLSEVMVVGEGGMLQFQQDPDENDRCIAKLVVRLPSWCSGGALVVQPEGSKNQLRYTLGENRGMAAFKPHYALYTTGAFRAVEQVTSGLSLMLVYSLCLPPELPFIRGSNGSDMLRMGLAASMMKLGGAESGYVKGENANSQNATPQEDGGNSTVALMLSRSFQLQDMTNAGTDTQASLDLDRFAYLRDANAILPPNNQLRFYVAHLHYVIPDAYGRWDLKRADESVTWYTIRGEQLGAGTQTSMSWTDAFNFLNPGKEMLQQLWKNDEGEFVYNFDRYAVVGWPTREDIEKTHVYMGESAAAASVFMDNPVDIGRLQLLLTYEANQMNRNVAGIPSQLAAIVALNDLDGVGYTGAPGPDYGSPAQKKSVSTASKAAVSLGSCQNLCKAIIGLNDASLMSVFFTKFFVRLGQKRELVPWLAAIVRKFGWDEVSEPFTRAFDGLPYSASMGLALQLADELIENPCHRSALATIAVRNAGYAFATCPEELVSSSAVGLLWKHSMACPNQQVFRDVGNLFARVDVKLWGPIVDALAKCGAAASSSPEHRELLLSMASTRRKWLMAQVAETEKPFAWEILDTNFIGAAGMATFLEGPNTSYQVRCFKGVGDAHLRMAVLREKIRAPLKMTVGGQGRSAYVLVTKQAGKFMQKTQDIHRFKAEIYQLNHLLAGGATTASGAGNTTAASSAGHVAGISNSVQVGPAPISTASPKTTNASAPKATGTKRPREDPDVIVIE